MIALLLLMVVALAVVQTALVGMKANLQNSMRDEAVNVADLQMNQLRDEGFNLVSSGTLTAIPRTFRAGVVVNYTPTITVTSINADTKQVAMTVGWPFAGKNYTHSVTTIMRRQ